MSYAKRNQDFHDATNALNNAYDAAEMHIEEVEEENDRLRDLTSFVLRFETMTDGCGDTCPYVCLNCKNECYFRKIASELGIEVHE